MLYLLRRMGLECVHFSFDTHIRCNLSSFLRELKNFGGGKAGVIGGVVIEIFK